MKSIRGSGSAMRSFPVCFMNPLCYPTPTNNQRAVPFCTGLMLSMGNAETPDFDALGVLAAKAQQGDDAAYESLLEALYSYVGMVLRARLGMTPELEDLIQTCVLAMHESLPTYHPSRNLRPWVQAIIRYKLADHFRALARRKEFAMSETVLEFENAHQEAKSRSESRVNVYELMKQLPAGWARAVQLTKFEGMSCEEAAGIEGISAGALRKRASRAYKRLADLIEKELES